MHIHGASMSNNAVGLYSMAAAEKAAQAQRAAEVRKKLLKASERIGGDLDSDESLLIGHWLGSRDYEAQGDDEYRPSASNKEPNLA